MREGSRERTFAPHPWASGVSSMDCLHFQHPPYFASSMSCIAALLLTGIASGDEVRQFQVLIDGKPAGTHQFRIASGAAGRTVVTAQADVKARFGLIPYTYSFRGQEVWNGARLESLQCTSLDGGTRTVLSASMDERQIRVTVNGRTRADGPIAWTTLEWQLPPVR